MEKNFLATIGRVFLSFMAAVGRITVFTAKGLRHCVTPPFYLRLIGKQMIYVGSSRFNAESAVATIVVIGLTRELAPVLSGLMIAGRVGAAIAAEIGTMRVTEQIDALVTLSTNPFKYLVAPRLIAGLVTLPFLVLIGDIIGVSGGFLVATEKLGFNASNYLNNTFEFLEISDVVSGLIKAGVFGFIVSLMGCYHGFHSTGGAQGVGKATTNAVVSSFVLILISYYFLTVLLIE